MKFKFLLSAFVLLSIQAFSQSKNNVSLVYGIAANDVNIHGAIGDYGYHNRTGTTYGLSYTRIIKGAFSLESGLLFSNNKIRLDYFRPGIGSVIVDNDLHMISVPLYAKYTFLKYLFLQGGVSLDLQTNYSNDSNLDKQSGLGLEFGFGGKVNFGKVSLFLNPFYSNHAINAHNNLMEAGVKFGLGYNF